MVLLFNNFGYFNVLFNLLIFFLLIQTATKWRNYWPLASNYTTTAPLSPNRLGESRPSQRRDAISFKTRFLDIFVKFLFSVKEELCSPDSISINKYKILFLIINLAMKILYFEFIFICRDEIQM